VLTMDGLFFFAVAPYNEAGRRALVALKAA